MAGFTEAAYDGLTDDEAGAERVFEGRAITVDTEVDVDNARELLRTSPEFFIQFFLAEKLTTPVPQLHVELFTLMTSSMARQLALAVPRGFAKTTIAKLAVIWFWLFSDAKFTVYASNTATVAQGAVRDIVEFLECDNFKQVFGDVRYVINQGGVGFYRFYIENKLCTLRALGNQQQIRGLNIANQRPEIIIADDIEDNENTNTEEMRQKTKDWFYGPLKKSFAKTWKLIHIGNMINAHCLLHYHCRSPYWTSRRYGAIKADGTPLWPDLWDMEALKQDYREYRLLGKLDSWFAEMMNVPVAAGRGLIRPEEIQYAPEVAPKSQDYGFITVDPAISNKTWAHQSVIAVHVWMGSYWQIAEIKHATGVDPLMLFNNIVHLCFKWGIRVVGIEAQTYQASLLYVFPHFMLEQHLTGIEFYPLMSGNISKTMRIAGWCSMIKKGAYRLTEGDIVITEQLLGYNPTQRDNDDDIIDAGAYGVHMQEMYLDEITKVFAGEPEGESIPLAYMQSAH